MRLSAWLETQREKFLRLLPRPSESDALAEGKGPRPRSRVEDNQGEFGGGQSVEYGPQMGQPFALQRFDNDLVAGIGRFSALAPLRQRLLWIEIERDHPFAGACGYLGEGRGKCRFSGTAFLREKSDAAHQATFCSAAVAASFR